MAESFNCNADPNRALPHEVTCKKVEIFTPSINFDKEQASPAHYPCLQLSFAKVIPYCFGLLARILLHKLFTIIINSDYI